MAQKPTTRRRQKKAMRFVRQESMKLAPDVLLLLQNVSRRRLGWKSKNQLMNAGLRHAFRRFAPRGMALRLEPCDELFFSQILTQ